MSLATTILLDAATPSAQGMQAFEDLLPPDDIIRAFMRDTASVINEAEYLQQKKSLRRPVKIPVLKNEAFFVNTVRQINPTPDVVGSDMVDITFSTFTFSFTVSRTLNNDNYISNVAEVERGIRNGVISAILNDPTKSLEQILVAYLEANKYAIPPASGVPGVTVGAGAYEMDADQYMIKSPVVMRELLMRGRMMDIANIASAARERDIATYGRANSRNLDQYLTQFDYYKSDRIEPTPGNIETHFLIPPGSLGLVNWNELDGHEETVTDYGYYTMVRDPYFGFDWTVFITTDRGDFSATAGAGTERAARTRFDFATSLAPVSPYSSDANKSPIVKFDLQSA